MLGVDTVYKAAKLNALNESWQPVRSMTSDQEMKGEIEDVRARCRDLVRNNALGSAVVTNLRDYIGSTGLTPVNGDDGLMEIWEEFAETCGVSGMDSWEDICGDIIAAQAETGDILMLTPINKNKKGIQTSIELVEGDRVRTPRDFKEGVDVRGRSIRNGVVFDSFGAEIGYYVCKINPRTSTYLEGGVDKYFYYDVYGESGRFNAKLIRRPDRKRPGQTRQLPIFISVAQQFWDTDAFWDAGISRARALSLIALIMEGGETQNMDTAFGVDPSATAAQYTNDFGEPMNVGSIPSGGIIKVPYGTKTNTVVPSGAMDLDVLMVRSIRLMGAAMGLPFEIMCRDFSQTNFSSGKLSHDGFFRLVDRWNRGNGRQFATPLYRLVGVEASLRGDPRAKNLTPERLKVGWIGGPRSYNADPGRESSAEETRLNNNLITEEYLAAADGRKHIDVLRSMARVIRDQRMIEQEYGLPEGSLSRKPATGGQPKAQPVEPVEPKETENKEEENAKTE